MHCINFTRLYTRLATHVSCSVSFTCIIHQQFNTFPLFCRDENLCRIEKISILRPIILLTFLLFCRFGCHCCRLDTQYCWRQWSDSKLHRNEHRRSSFHLSHWSAIWRWFTILLSFAFFLERKRYQPASTFLGSPSPHLSMPLRPTQPGRPSVCMCNEYWRWFRPPLGEKRRVLRSSVPCDQ